MRVFLSLICFYAVLSESYVDAENGSDNAKGTEESPFKSLSVALSSSGSDESVIYLREQQTFSDLKSIVSLTYPLTIKCWTKEGKNSLPESYANIQLNQPDVSFLVAASLKFEGIRFKKVGENLATTLINMTANSTLILQNVEFRNYSFAGVKSLISSETNSSVYLRNTTFSGLDFKQASILKFTNGIFYANGILVDTCTFNGSSGFEVNGNFSFDLRNSKFNSNEIYENPFFLLKTETEAPIKIDSINVVKNIGAPLQLNTSMAIFLSLTSQQSEIFLSNSYFEENSVARAGTSGLRVSGNKFEVSNCKFINNRRAIFPSYFTPEDRGVLTIYSSTATIRDSEFSGSRHNYGGAIFYQGNSALTISGSKFTNNQAFKGGAIYIQPLNPRQMIINITDSEFYKNIARGESVELASYGRGGAIYLIFPDKDQINCSLSRNTFTSNEAQGSKNRKLLMVGLGGAVYLKKESDFFEPTSNLTLTGNLFAGNIASGMGGGLYCIDALQIFSTENAFKNNTALAGFGGGVAILQSKYFDKNTTYNGNTAGEDGGAIFAQDGIFSFDNTDFFGNIANWRGGCLFTQTAELTIINTNFSDCMSHSLGGGLFIATKSISLITNTLFKFCSSIEGGAIYYASGVGNYHQISMCSFLNNTSKSSLILSLDGLLEILDTNFTNTTGTILAAPRLASEIRLKDILVVNTLCRKSGSGCLLDAAFGVFRLSNVTVVNMTISPENSAIFLNSVYLLTLENSNFLSIFGPAHGACFSASNSQHILISNFSVNSFSFGCFLIENPKTLKIQNFTAENNDQSKNMVKESDVSIQEGSVIQLNAVVGASLSNITIKGNRNFLRTKGGAIHLRNSRNISLVNGILRDNCAETGGGLFIQNTTAHILNITFLNNTAIQGGGLYAENSPRLGQVTLNLSNLNFTENSANLTGGGAHFEEISHFNLTKATFFNNKGLESVVKSSLMAENSKGGAIYYSCEKKNGSRCMVNIQGLNVTNNSAEVGGAIYFKNTIFDPSNRSNFANNSATGLKRYGPTFASYPVQILHDKEIKNDTATAIRMFKNGTSVSREHFIQNYFISNITDSENWKRFVDTTSSTLHDITVEIKYFNQTGGASLKQPLSFYALDHFGQQIEVDNDTYYVKVDPASSIAGKNAYKSYSINGSFLFGDKFISYPGTGITLLILTNIDCILFNSSNIQVKIAFKLCDTGEIIPHGSEICSICPPNSYSLLQANDSSTICKSCENVTGLKCKQGGEDLTVGPEYWRYSKSSLSVIRCFNPAACTPAVPDTNSCPGINSLMKSLSLEEACHQIGGLSRTKAEDANCPLETIDKTVGYCAKMLNGTERGVCNDGYEGVLCAECAEGWGRSKAYECVKCDKRFSFFAQMILVGLLKIGLIVYTIHEAQKDKQAKLHSIALRILITFFQIESMLFEVPMYWPPFFDQIRRSLISFFRSGVNSGGFSYDCLIDWMSIDFGLTYYELNTLLSPFAPLLWTVAAGIFLLTRKYIFKKQVTWEKAQDILVITWVVTYFYFWPDIITTAFSTMKCFDVGAGDLKLFSAPYLTCFSGRHWTFLVFGIATLTLLGFVFPFLFFLKLRRIQNSLDDENFVKKYGFFYRGYKDQFYLWEFLVLIRKMVLVSTYVFLSQSLTSMCITLSIIIGISTILQQRFSPFKHEILNKLELNALSCLAVLSYGCLYHLDLADASSKSTFVVLAAGSTAVFLFPWLWAYIGMLSAKIESVCQSLKSHSKKCWGCLKRAVKGASKRIFRSDSMDNRRGSVDSPEFNIETNQEKKIVIEDESLTGADASSLTESLLNNGSVVHSKKNLNNITL